MQGTNLFSPTDLLRRSTPTPLRADLRVLRYAVRLETNSGAALERAEKAFPGECGAQSGGYEFLWRLVIEPDAGHQTERPAMAGFTDRGLTLVNLGQYSFIAVDLTAREAVIFLEERFLRDELWFTRQLLPALVKLTSAPRPEDHP